MCELLAVAYPSPQAFAEVLPWALELERLGIAGFGWGVAWLEGGRVNAHRHPSSLRGDPEGARELSRVRSERFLVHLRRPSRLLTVGLADTQPFLAAAGRLAFCHNGSFHRHEQLRPRFEGLAGQADSEVGFRLFEAGLAPAGDLSAAALISAFRRTHDALGGNANLACLDRTGTLAVYGAHANNTLWRFQVGEADVAATGLHSDDRALFKLLFIDAAGPALVGREGALVGSPLPAAAFQ